MRSKKTEGARDEWNYRALPFSLGRFCKYLLSDVSRPMAPSVTFGDSSRRLRSKLLRSWSHSNIPKLCRVVSLPLGEGGPQTLRLRWMRCSGTKLHCYYAGDQWSPLQGTLKRFCRGEHCSPVLSKVTPFPRGLLQSPSVTAPSRREP